MPKAQEEALKRVANRLARGHKLRTSKKYSTLKEAKNAFVYGTMAHQKKG